MTDSWERGVTSATIRSSSSRLSARDGSRAGATSNMERLSVTHEPKTLSLMNPKHQYVITDILTQQSFAFSKSTMEASTRTMY